MASPVDDAAVYSGESAARSGIPKAKLAVALIGAALVAAGAYGLVASRDQGDESLVPAMIDLADCEMPADVCRAFSDRLWRGNRVTTDHAFSERLLTSSCARGDAGACIDWMIRHERARIETGRVPSIGLPSAQVGVIVALDFRSDDFDAWVERMVQLELRHHGNARVHVVATDLEHPVARMLGEISCVFESVNRLGNFQPNRAAYATLKPKFQLTGIELAGFVAMDAKFIDMHLEACRKIVGRQEQELKAFGVGRSGTIFVDGKRLDPPYSNDAIDLLVGEAKALFADPKKAHHSSSERLASARERLAVRPTSKPERLVQMIVYCDPASAMCQTTSVLNSKTIPKVFGSEIATDFRAVEHLGSPERTSAACALFELGMGEQLRDAQLDAPKKDGKKVWLSPENMRALALDNGIDAALFRSFEEGECRTKVETHRNELRNYGHPPPVVFINGRPTRAGQFSGTKNLLVRELKLAETLSQSGQGGKRAANEIRQLLLTHRLSFSTPSIEPSEGLR